MDKEAITKKDPKTIQIVDDFYLGADNYCFILYRRKRVTGGGNGKQPKDENIGKYNYVATGYYTTLGGVFSAVVSQHAKEAINKAKIKTLEDLAADMEKFVEHTKKIDMVFLNAMKEKGGVNE